MADFLLELFSEEIPARMQDEAAQVLERKLCNALTNAGIQPVASKRFVTPRRLAVIAEGLPITQPDLSVEHKGPKVGAPEAALQGFLKKTGVAKEQLEVRDGIYFAKVEQQGKPTAALLKDVIEAILMSFPWPKSMRWGSGDAVWVRPLQSILCLFDGKVVPVVFADVSANNVTYGHRFLSPSPITINSAAEYEPALEKAHVIADREKRKGIIQRQATMLAMDLDLHLKPDQGLLEEVTGLVEWPMTLTGSIDEAFMDLPKEVLVSEMRAHQKYFALLKKNSELANRFLLVANTTTPDGGKAIIAGNERVLRARLSDGRFFWDQDRKKTLDEWSAGLDAVTYHAKLGSMGDKVLQIKKLTENLFPPVYASMLKSVPADQRDLDKSSVAQMATHAAQLCKADLVTGMVGEFPELQGVMGRYYALEQGEVPMIADAIRDHYKPLGPSDSVPNDPVSISVALADKIVTLNSMFSINEKPTGSKDPFALRRAGLGVVRILVENNIRMRINDFVSDDVLLFLIERLKFMLKDQGVRHDVIESVRPRDDGLLARIVTRAAAVQNFLSTDDGANLLNAYRRAVNILIAEEKKDGIVYAHDQFNAALLKEKEEIILSQSLEERDRAIEDMLLHERYTETMTLLSTLRQPVDQFFEKITVNDKDTSLRTNRLCLLARIKYCMDRVADFGKIEG